MAAAGTRSRRKTRTAVRGLGRGGVSGAGSETRGSHGIYVPRRTVRSPAGKKRVNEGVKVRDIDSGLRYCVDAYRVPD